MPADDKILERVAKLLRLAAPSSGTTDAERASAALEVAKLVEDHSIDLGAVLARPKPKLQHEPHRTSPHAWVLSVALQHCGCAHCHCPISPGDVVWTRILPGLEIERRHNYGPCKLA
jgi:hypothetical protein